MFRKTCNEVMERAKQAVPWFGIEQVRGENIYQKNIRKNISLICHKNISILFSSTRCWTRTATPSAGPRTGSRVPRAPTTAASARTR